MPPASPTEAQGGPLVERLAIIGAGLIGASIAHAARATGAARDIVIHDISPAVRARVRELGFANVVAETAADAARDSDLVVLCVPVGQLGAAAASIAGALKPGAILSDAGSVKTAAVRDIAPHVPAGVHFVPAHPVAGTEHSGPDAGFAELFEGRWCLLTPPPDTDAAAIAMVRRFWERLGSRVEVMTAERHDLVLAVTSHLPHVIAYTIVGTASELERVTQSEVIKFSAGGFRDFTRIAASDPVMWRDILLANREAVLEMLDRLTADVAEVRAAIEAGDGAALHERFTRTRAIRRGILEAGQD